MKYALLICGFPEWGDSGNGDSKNMATPECVAWVEDLTSKGVLQQIVGLQPPRDATTVRVRADEVLVSDGPFAETKDQVGGVGVIECADLDEAVEIASRHPAARYGSIEVRPLWEG